MRVALATLIVDDEGWEDDEVCEVIAAVLEEVAVFHSVIQSIESVEIIEEGE